MRLIIARAAIAVALPLFLVAPALADEQHDRLMKMCTENDPAPATCECQVKVLEENIDAKTMKTFLAVIEAESAATPADAEKAAQAAYDEAGTTKEEFEKAMSPIWEKIGPAMEACRKA